MYKTPFTLPGSALARLVRGFALLLASAGSAPLHAQIEILGIRVDADVSFTRAGVTVPLAQDSETWYDSDLGASAAQASVTLPAFGGPPLATQWTDATARAYQSIDGFNSTAVAGAFANGQSSNRLEATTTWTVSAWIPPVLITLPQQVSFEYFIFPGEVGLSNFASAGEAGFSASIRAGRSGSTGSVFFDQVRISAGPGFVNTVNVGPAFTANGFTQAGLNRDNVNYTHVVTEPIIAEQDLGYFRLGEPFDVIYTLKSWVHVPGYELAGFASVADPFALAADPAAYLAQVFPGLDLPGLVLTATPVPEPATWALWAGGVSALWLGFGRRQRKRAEPA